MAVHYTERAALLPLPAAKKLVLMCVADSANQHDRVGFPGLPAIQQWSGLGRSRALEVIAELVTEGYLVRHRGGVNGRRAEFVVFPHGCCALHEPLSGYGPELPGHESSGSGGPDPENSQGPVEGPVEGPAQTGPLPSFVTPVVTSAGTSREQGSDSAHRPSSLPSVEPPAAPPRRPPAPPTAELDPAPAGSSEPPAELGGAGHQAFRRVRQVLACSLCDHAGLLPTGAPCTHPRRDEAAAG